MGNTESNNNTQNFENIIRNKNINLEKQKNINNYLINQLLEKDKSINALKKNINNQQNQHNQQNQQNQMNLQNQYNQQNHYNQMNQRNQKNHQHQ